MKLKNLIVLVIVLVGIGAGVWFFYNSQKTSSIELQKEVDVLRALTAPSTTFSITPEVRASLTAPK
ncbi:MAG: hypothetical protein AAB611_03025 [Patescibacteria group bacterium]